MMTKELFAHQWFCDNDSDSIYWIDVAECYVDWGLGDSPYSKPMDEVLADVLEAADIKKKHNYSHSLNFSDIDVDVVGKLIGELREELVHREESNQDLAKLPLIIQSLKAIKFKVKKLEKAEKLLKVSMDHLKLAYRIEGDIRYFLDGDADEW